MAKINGIELYYEVHGEGVPLLLIAGYGHHSLIWQNVVEELSKKYKVILFDNRGMGRSEIAAPPYTIEMMAQDTVALLDHLGIEKAHVIGHSMGGAITQQMAKEYPERLLSCVLYSTLTHLPKASEMVMRVTMELFTTAIDPRIACRNAITWAYGSTFLAMEGIEELLIQSMIDNPFPIQPDGIMGQYAALTQFDSRPFLSEIKTPTLLIAGNEDISTPLYTAEILKEKLAGAKCVTLPHIGHSCHIENPPIFLKTVQEFIG